MKYKNKFNGQHYDVGTGENISLNEVKTIVKKYHDIDFVYVEERKGDVLLTKANIEPLLRIGWKANTNLQSGIDKCLRFQIKDNRS